MRCRFCHIMLKNNDGNYCPYCGTIKIKYNSTPNTLLKTITDLNAICDKLEKLKIKVNESKEYAQDEKRLLSNTIDTAIVNYLKDVRDAQFEFNKKTK